jgi:tetratricopeptide (TPR) repeat protein
MLRRPICICLLFCLSLAGVAEAGARSGEAFREHLVKARRLARERRYDLAISEYQAAYATRPRPRVLLQMARTLRQQGDIETSFRCYELYMRSRPGLSAAEKAAIGAELHQALKVRAEKARPSGRPLRQRAAVQ